MRLLFLWLAISQAALGQVASTAETKHILTGIDGWELLGSSLVVPPDSKPAVQPVGLLKIDSEASQKSVRASDAQRQPVRAEQVEPSTWIIYGQGIIWIDVICVDFEARIFEVDQFTIEIGTAPAPDPDIPDPDPPAPGPFDNLSQKVHDWSAGLPARDQVHPIYVTAARVLRTDPSVTVGSVSLWLRKNIDLAVGSSGPQWESFRANVNADLQSRWQPSYGKAWMAEYYLAIAEGLK